MRQHELQRILKYDPVTGIFTWAAKTSRKVVVGSVAGGKNLAGYTVIGIGGRTYYAHRLAFVYMTGSTPHQIDHKDGERGNNAWANLRPATHQQNILNAKLASSNTSGFKGVSWHKAAGKWSAYIILDDKKKHLGLFDAAEDAHRAYINAARSAQPDFVRAA